jgi:hypothetical protein
VDAALREAEGFGSRVSTGPTGIAMVHLVEGHYKCDWCGADLNLAFADNETFTTITQNDDVDVRTIVVSGEEHHRCERSQPDDRP